MKIFLTGERQIGKSTCIQKFIEKNQIPICGFQTKPLYDGKKRIGFYMHSLIEMEERDRRISIQHETYNEVIPDIFNTFAYEILLKSAELKDHLLILDEIGIMESNETRFIEGLMSVIQKHEHVLGVLKKKEAVHLAKIKNMKDVIILNLAEITREDALQRIEEEWFKSKDIGCILLAAGNSSRFGSNKLLHKLKGKKVVEIILDKLAQLPFSKVAVVSQYQPILEMAKDRDFLPVYNDNPEMGISHSILLGAKKIKDCKQLMFVLADQPNLQLATLLQLMNLSNNHHIICVESKGVIQNPMIIPAAYYDELLCLKGDKGAKKIALSHERKVISLLEQECYDLDEVCDLDRF